MNEQHEYTQRGMETRDLGDVFVATQIEMWRQRINADNAQLGALVWELMQAEAQALQLRLDLGATVERADKAAIELAAVTAERDALAAQREQAIGAVPGAGNATMPDAEAWVKRQMGSTNRAEAVNDGEV